MSLEAMAVHFTEKVPVHYDAKYWASRIRLEAGATLLTSLGYTTAIELVSGCDTAKKRRLMRNSDDSIELITSVWVEYGDTHTDLHDINDFIRIKDRIISLCEKQNNRDASIVIVDWGCGSGHTLAQLDIWLQEKNITCVQLFGYANEIHPDWQHAPENITFILDVAENLPLYFEEETIDFMYSIAGLYYLFLPEQDGHDDDMVEFFKKNNFDESLFRNYSHTQRHLEQLSDIIKANGELLIDLPTHVIDIDYSLLSAQSRKYTTLRNPKKYGENAYVMVPSHPVSTRQTLGGQWPM